ncbi:MAG: prevent-host-death protein [Clostridia bacterium]|nr:prevent-host-death protein [Clostridia bacterium]
MEHVGIRELRDRLTAYLRRARAGEVVLILDRKTPIARLGPAAPELEVFAELAAQGLIEWGGGKPQGATRPPRVREGRVSDLVLEGRR